MEKYDTLKYYNENAEAYCEATKNGNMEEAYNRFLVLLPDKAYILDFGCGSGRDSKYFLAHGYTVRAIDGSEKLCELASEYIGQKVDYMKFDELSDVETYDGIWACASILHVEREDLPNILRKMITALKEGDREVVQDGKYYNYINKEILEAMLREVDPDSQIVEYYENSTVANVNRPPATWGSYLIKK